MTFSPHVMHLLVETVAPFDLTTINVYPPGLDLSTDTLYRLYVQIKNTTGFNTPVYNIFFNGDSTETNYWCQITQSNGVALTAARVNAPRIEDQTLTNNMTFSSVIDIELNVDSKACYICTTRFRDGGGAGGIQTEFIGGQYTIIANVTSIQISSNIANAIAAGSTFRLFRVSTV